MPLKILHVCTDFRPAIGGTENFVLELARRTAALGVEPSVLCHRRTRAFATPLPAHDQIDGIPITRVQSINLKYYKPTWLPMDVLRAADVIHVHGIGAPLDGIALTQPLHQKPIVVSTHGGIFHTEALPSLKRWYFRNVVPMSGRRVTQFLACSRNDYRMFSEVVNRVTLLENGVALPAAVCTARDNNRLLHVGRFSENKRIEKLLLMMVRLRSLGRPATLRLVGPDFSGNRPRLAAKAKSLGLDGEVQFVGEVSNDQLAEEYASAAWLVSASRFEGFGLSLVEAMSAGCIPFVNRIPAFVDVIEDGRNGFITDFDDPSAAADSLSKLLDSPPPADIVTAARATSLKYSWDTAAPRFVETYREVLKNGLSQTSGRRAETSKQAFVEDDFRHRWEARRAACVAWPYSRWEYVKRMVWALIRRTIWPLCWARIPRLRTTLLRVMGAQISKPATIASSVRITFPGDLSIGDDVSIGDRATLYNLGGLQIGNYTFISQDVYICGGTHDASDPSYPLVRQKVVIGNYVWIAAGAFIGPGVHIGDGAVVGARAVVMKDVEPWTIVAGNPARVIRRRLLNI